jgi:methionyl-tRNA formyltransferase
MIQQQTIPITENMTAGELHDTMMQVGANLLVKTVSDIKNDNISTKKQDFSSDLKHAPKIYRKDCKIDVSQGVREVHNLIRGMSPYPAAWLSIENAKGQSKSLKLFKSKIETNETGGTVGLYTKENQLFLRLNDGVLKILVVQLEGKKKMDSDQLLTGYKPEDWSIIID